MADFNILPFRGALAAIVTQAGDIVRENNKKPRTIKHKGRIDLVTETDLAVELFLKEKLSELLPQADFLAEETSKETLPGELTWIIDPLDGTTNFAHSLPFVAISVALWHRDRVVAGVVDLPLLGEQFVAIRDHGATLNDSPIAVSSATQLDQSILATGFPYDTEIYLENILKYLKRFLRLTQGVRRPGAAALDLAYVACGRYDGFYEYALNAWDTAAGLLLVEEAGGRVTRFDQAVPYHLGDVDILATNGHIHSLASAELIR
ncbi:MAG: inositol monophosphatase [Proteobacteria bacterium]|nr:inositol monophosphatase [Pseudomonadota bacterium]MBU1611703.1 inositol monophosphatase [Pseudomonadota bacterium]